MPVRRRRRISGGRRNTRRTKNKRYKKSNYENYQKTRDLCEKLSQLKFRIRNKQVKIDIYILQKEKSDSLN